MQKFANIVQSLPDALATEVGNFNGKKYAFQSTLDYQIPEAPRCNVNAESLDIGVKGNAYWDGDGSGDIVEPASEVPWHDDTLSQKFQLHISNYTIGTFLNGFFDSHPNFGYNFSVAYLESIHTKLSTSDFNYVAPGIEAMYGVEKPMAGYINLFSISNLRSYNEVNLTVDLDFEMIFSV